MLISRTINDGRVARPVKTHLFLGDVGADHHVEDGEQLGSRDVVVSVKVVHTEGNCEKKIRGSLELEFHD